MTTFNFSTIESMEAAIERKLDEGFKVYRQTETLVDVYAYGLHVYFHKDTLIATVGFADCM